MKNNHFKNTYFIVKPGSIQVDQAFQFKFGNKSSPFSNHFDLRRSAKALGDKIYTAPDANDPQYKEWQVFDAHQRLLAKHLQDTTGKAVNLVWGEYEVFASEDERFNKIGRLSNKDTDYLQLHTKQAFRMWEGNPNWKNGPKWPGVRYGLKLSSELFTLACKDNPYAQQALIQFEEGIHEIEVYFGEVRKQIDTQLNYLSQNGINISMIQNRHPVEIPLYSIRNYGFKLIKLLVDYDHFILSVKTLMVKGLTSNKDGHDTIHHGSKLFRRLLLDLYLTTMKLKAVEGLTRNSFLDETIRQKLTLSIEQEYLDPLPLSIFNYEQQPSLVFIDDKLPEETLSEILDAVRGSNIVTTEPIS